MSAALAVFIVGVLAIVAAVVLLIVRPGTNNNGSTVQASTIPFAARVDRLDGDIGIARQTDAQNGSYQGWSKATVNAPVSLGDRIYTSSGSKAAIAINRKNYVRLNPGTSLDVVSLSQGHTQLALREGACVFDVGALESGETYEVGTPSGAVDFTEPGLYQIGIDEGSDTVVSVLNGHCQVAGVAGAGEVSKGQLLTFAAAEAAEAIVSDISPDVAGKIVDDYYSYRYQQAYDGRYRNYGAYESDPYYYEQSYRRSESYRYIPEDSDIAGVEDLDENGEWQDVPSYGHCWRPRTTSSDWAPYRDGYWSDDSTLGLTWVSNERWGWAPYHYGRWAHLNQGWYWVPSEITRHTTYSPALVAFVSPRADEGGWVPLGPGDPYVPRYYDRDYQPRYAGSRKEIDRYVNETSVVNYNDASAITMVSINQFTRVITPATVLRPDPSWRETARPIVDPYAVPVVRRIAPTLEASRPVVAVPVETQQSFNRPVIMRRQPVAPSATTNIAETLKVQAVPETAVKQKLKVKNIGAVTTTQANGIPAVPPEAKVAVQTPEQRDARINALAAQAAQGNKAAKREMRQLEAQQQAQQQQELKSQRKAMAQQEAAQQQQQAEQQKAEKRTARQQAQQAAAQAEQQRQAQAAQQAEQQKAQKQAARQQAAQQAEQQKAEKRAARQQAQQQPAAQAEQQRQAQAAHQAEQQKAQKQAARQQAAQQAEQQKAEKRAARQQAQQPAAQAEQQRQTQAAQQAEQQKAQKQAARQQAQEAAAQAEQRRQAQIAQQAEQQKAQKRAARQQAEQAAQQQAQQGAARQQNQQEQKRIQKQAQQQAAQQAQEQAQQQKQQQKQQRRAEAQSAEQNAAQPNSNKAEKRAQKAKNKNSN